MYLFNDSLKVYLFILDFSVTYSVAIIKNHNVLLCTECFTINCFWLCKICDLKSTHSGVNFLLCSLGYSLLLVRNSGSYLTDSDNLTSQWTSDVFSVADTSVCLAVDLVLPSLVQAKLFQVSLNGTGWNQSVFLSGSVTDERIRGVIQMSLDSDASQIQIALFFNENATIHNISLEFGSCHRNGKQGNRNRS